MNANAVFFGWNRPIPGRERVSAQHFDEFVQYLGGLQQAGTIQSFDVVLLDPHGGDMNGFFLIRGVGAKLGAMVDSNEWQTHLARAALHLLGSGAVLGATGDLIPERMTLWASLLPA